jgi:hypothetical protein
VLSETAGRTVLKEAFEAQGYAIQENYPLRVGGVEVELDGYDPEAGIGYEYITGEDGLAPAEIECLLQQQHCLLFLIDEKWVPDAPALITAVFQWFRQLDAENDERP